MKAKLIKRDNDYCLYNESGETIAASWANVTGKKLSKQNCDEIFGVVDVDDMMENILSNCEKTKDGYILGFQMAMELNKDKVFTLEDMRNTMDWIMTQYFEFYEQPTTGRREQYLESLQQPTEIEVEIVMENSRTGKIIKSESDLEWDEDGLCDRAVPKLDSEGCLILKKI